MTTLDELRAKFRQAVREMGGAAAAAKVLGCTRVYVEMLGHGKRRRPGMRVAFAIEKRIGIRMQEWMACS